MTKSTVNFQFTFGDDNELSVEADVYPGRPACAADMNHSGEPAEHPEVEITSCDLMADVVAMPFNPDHIYIKSSYEVEVGGIKQERYIPLTDLIHEEAIQQWEQER